MRKIVLDQELRAKLNGLNEQMEMCDEAGKTMGRYLPATQYRRMLYAIAEAACPYTEEELHQFQQETGGQPLAELWKSLGQA